jgi:hypothetical protein
MSCSSKIEPVVDNLGAVIGVVMIRRAQRNRLGTQIWSRLRTRSSLQGGFGADELNLFDNGSHADACGVVFSSFLCAQHPAVTT